MENNITPVTGFGPLDTGLVEPSSAVLSLRDHPAAELLAQVVNGDMSINDAIVSLAKYAESRVDAPTEKAPAHRSPRM